MDVAEVEFSLAEERKEDLADQTRECYASALPLMCGSDVANQQAHLLIPASEAGKAYGEQACKTIPELRIVRVPGQADLMFCREQGYLSMEDMQRLLRSCRAAYQLGIVLPRP